MRLYSARPPPLRFPPSPQAGLALALVGWLLELLAGAPLAALALRDARAALSPSDAMTPGNAKLLAPARLPAALAVTLAVAAARAGAVAAGEGYVRAKLQTYFDYEAQLPGGYSNAVDLDAGTWLLLLALVAALVAALCNALALHYAHPDAVVPRQPFFFNPQRQPPVPKTLTRGCSENATIWLACIITLVTAAVGIVWYLFCNGSTAWPLPIVVTAALLAINGKWVADYVQETNQTTMCFLHLCVEYVLIFACLFCLVLGFVSIDQVSGEARSAALPSLASNGARACCLPAATRSRCASPTPLSPDPARRPTSTSRRTGL